MAKLTHARFCYGAARLLGCKRRTLLNHLRIGLQLTITRLAGLNQRGLRLLDLQGESCNTIAPTNQAGDVVLNDIQSTAEALRHVHSLARQLTHPLQTKQLSKQLLDFRGLVASNRFWAEKTLVKNASDDPRTDSTQRLYVSALPSDSDPSAS